MALFRQMRMTMEHNGTHTRQTGSYSFFLEHASLKLNLQSHANTVLAGFHKQHHQ